MKKYKTSDTLTEGDIVEYEHDKTWNDESTAYFKAVCIDKTKPCMKQCNMAGVKWHKHCTGFCFRWENGDNFVFVQADVDPKNVTVTQTFRAKLDKENN